MSTVAAPKQQYNIEAYFNGERVTVRSTDIEKTMVALKPEQLHTEMYLTVERKGAVAERKLNLVQGRKLFNDEAFREIFINNLLLP